MLNRLPLPGAYVDPAFLACLRVSIETPELAQNFDRLYGASLMFGKPSRDDMQAFVQFVHNSIYLRLSDEAIESLRVHQEVNHA
jgi:hypothetical protein